MQTRGRFIQDIQRPPRRAFAELFRQFDALRLPARQRRRLLTHLDVAQAHTHQCIHFFADAGDRLEEALRVLDGHIQHVSDGLALELHLKRFAVIALAFAGFTFDIDIRQEVHLDLDHTVALTGLAAAALDVKAETPGLVPARLGFGQTGKPVADRGEGTGIGRRIRPRRAPDGALVNVDHLVQMLQPLDRLARRRRLARPVQVHRRGLEQGLDRQGRLPAA